MVPTTIVNTDYITNTATTVSTELDTIYQTITNVVTATSVSTEIDTIYQTITNTQTGMHFPAVVIYSASQHTN